MASAAYTCVVKQTGTAVAATGEATTFVAANEYQITNTAKRIIDPDTAITVYDNGTPQPDTNVIVNYLFGKVKLAAGNFNGPVTIDYSYLPTYEEAGARSFEINMSRDLFDSTVMASTTAVRAKTALLKDCSGSVTILDDLYTDLDSGGTTIRPWSDWSAGTKRVLEVTFPSGQIFRAFVLFKDVPEKAAFDGVVEATINWEAAPAIGTDQTEGSSFGFSSGNPDGYD